jgi:hypothetical protein
VGLALVLGVDLALELERRVLDVEVPGEAACRSSSRLGSRPSWKQQSVDDDVRGEHRQVVATVEACRSCTP